MPSKKLFTTLAEAIQQFSDKEKLANVLKNASSDEEALKLLQSHVLPPPENSARTQIVNTKPTYDKAREILRQEGVDKNIIDYGAGKGMGSYGWAESFEPYAKGWYPTYTKAEDIPSDKYSGLLNLNVLNVLPPELREIGRAHV